MKIIETHIAYSEAYQEIVKIHITTNQHGSSNKYYIEIGSKEGTKLIQVGYSEVRELLKDY